MNNEKRTAFDNENHQTQAFVKLDFRKLSLATIILGILSMVVIGIFSNLDQSLTRKLVLGGAYELLETAKRASTLVAFATVISRVNVGSLRLVEVAPGNSSGCVRALVVAGILTFLWGGMEDFVMDKIYEMTKAEIMAYEAYKAESAASAAASAAAAVMN